MQLEHGKEKHPTFYMYRKVEKPYHIDYCFASEEIMNNGFDFSTGEFKDWIELSDHTPITVKIYEINQKEIVDSLSEGLKSKFEKLLPITKEKFGKLIEELINQAKLTDKDNSSVKSKKWRVEIIDNAERIIKINEIIGQIKIKNVG